LKTPSVLIVAIVVDDGLICAPTIARIHHILESMKGVYEVKDTTHEVYVGVHIQRNRRLQQIHIYQTPYILAKIQAFGYNNCSPTTVLVDYTTQF
jgi:hypothetical protein